MDKLSVTFASQLTKEDFKNLQSQLVGVNKIYRFLSITPGEYVYHFNVLEYTDSSNTNTIKKDYAISDGSIDIYPIENYDIDDDYELNLHCYKHNTNLTIFRKFMLDKFGIDYMLYLFEGVFSIRVNLNLSITSTEITRKENPPVKKKDK